jgi:Flp pilus assembly protein TadG
MRTRFQHLRRNEDGMAVVFVGLGFMGFLIASMLAIDVGLLMTARAQAQNAADAGALGGAIALALNDWDDRTDTGPAVQSAVTTASSNLVMQGGVSVTPADVTFPTGPTGLNNRVQVTVFRSAERSNPFNLAMGPIFGFATASVQATATAEASPADAATCLLPFTIPDKWEELNQPGGWTPTSEFRMYDNQGNPLPLQDHYEPGIHGTGYDMETDKGMLIRLKSNVGSSVAPGIYFPWSIGGVTGADDYRENIAQCNPTVVHNGQPLLAEPGNMVGPTLQGLQDLINQDLSARWSMSCQCVQGSTNPRNPRVRTLPLYDPVFYETGKANGRFADFKMISMLGVFLEDIQGGEVWARITPITALTTGTNPTPSSFATAIRLVE